MRGTAYVGGPMNGLEDYNYPAFFEAEARLIAGGEFKRIINPAALDDSGVPAHDTLTKEIWRSFLKRDLKIIMDNDVDTLILLPGWRKSDGARLEARVCKDLMGATLLEYFEDGDGYTLKPTWVGNDKL